MKVGATTEIVDPQVMTWDTTFWGVRTAKAVRLDGLSEWAAANTVGLVYLLIDTDDTDAVHRAEAQGFQLMDTRVTLERPLRFVPRLGLLEHPRPEELPDLLEIAQTAFKHTRFYADPRLRDGSGQLYRAWTALTDTENVFVSRRKGRAVGYITVGHEAEMAQIGLVAVADGWHGKGIGRVLVDHACEWAADQGCEGIQVVTQAANVPALRTFERCQFRIVSSHYWLHKWYA